MNQPVQEKSNENENKENAVVFEKNVPSPIKQKQLLNSPFDVTSLKNKNFQASIQKHGKDQDVQANFFQQEVI